MLGLFGKKKEPETLLEKEKDRYGGSGFDPTGLERAAKAARARAMQQPVAHASSSPSVPPQTATSTVATVALEAGGRNVAA